MTRILDLQALDTASDESLEAIANSTSSDQGCVCSTSSFNACPANPDIIAI